MDGRAGACTVLEDSRGDGGRCGCIFTYTPRTDEMTAVDDEFEFMGDAILVDEVGQRFDRERPIAVGQVSAEWDDHCYRLVRPVVMWL